MKKGDKVSYAGLVCSLVSQDKGRCLIRLPDDRVIPVFEHQLSSDIPSVPSQIRGSTATPKDALRLIASWDGQYSSFLSALKRAESENIIDFNRMSSHFETSASNVRAWVQGNLRPSPERQKEILSFISMFPLELEEEEELPPDKIPSQPLSLDVESLTSSKVMFIIIKDSPIQVEVSKVGEQFRAVTEHVEAEGSTEQEAIFNLKGKML